MTDDRIQALIQVSPEAARRVADAIDEGGGTVLSTPAPDAIVALLTASLAEGLRHDEAVISVRRGAGLSWDSPGFRPPGPPDDVRERLRRRDES